MSTARSQKSKTKLTEPARPTAKRKPKLSAQEREDAKLLKRLLPRLFQSAQPAPPRTDPAAQLGGLLRQARLKQGIEVAEAASRAGISAHEVTMLEEGEADVPVEQYLHYADHLGMELEIGFRSKDGTFRRSVSSANLNETSDPGLEGG